jgi:hypothetical protein
MAVAVRQIRAWRRRAITLERRALDLMSDMIAVVGVEYEMAGENFTSQADEVAASATALASYLETCERLSAPTNPQEPADE